MKKKKECEHEIEYAEPCPQCGYVEGECKKCGKEVCGDESGNLEEC